MSAIPAESPELITRLRQPDTVREAFAEVMHLFSEPLYKQIRRMVPSHDDAADILQNTFMKAWTSLENFRGDARLSTWLYKIAINESLSFLARDSRHQHLSIDDEDNTHAHSLQADAPLDGEELAAPLRHALATLPEKQRLVFNMRYYDQMKYEDMSNILGTSVGALKASYHLAVKKIEQYFENLD